MIQRLDLPRRARAAGWHLLISALVAGVAAALVFGLWFSGIYRSVAGGRDLAVIGAVQLAGLIYGLYSVYQARPVAMVFETDRFRVISAE